MNRAEATEAIREAYHAIPSNPGDPPCKAREIEIESSYDGEGVDWTGIVRDADGITIAEFSMPDHYPAGASFEWL
jgi:hypothetical protein|tara:strand:+ start:60 stop:284 length:225 start_codon:yes stop_codon:yes gene_type:complete